MHRSLGLPEPEGYARDTYTDPAVLAYAEFGRAVAEKCTLSQRQRIAAEAKFTFDCYRLVSVPLLRGHDNMRCID